MTTLLNTQAELALAAYAVLVSNSAICQQLAQLRAADVTAAQAIDFAARYPTRR